MRRRWVFFYYARIVSTSLRYSREATAISDTYDESVRSHALAPKCRTEIDGGTMRRSVWSGKKTLRLAAVRSEDYRGVGIEREWETEGERQWEREEKKSRVKRGRPTAINQNPVTYCCVLYHYYIRVQCIVFARYTRTASCHVYISTIRLCVWVCVWRAKTHWPNLRSLSIDRHNNIIIYVCSNGSTKTCRRVHMKSM